MNLRLLVGVIVGNWDQLSREGQVDGASVIQVLLHDGRVKELAQVQAWWKR